MTSLRKERKENVASFHFIQYIIGLRCLRNGAFIEEVAVKANSSHFS